MHRQKQRCRSALLFSLTEKVQSLFFFNPKFQASSLFQLLYRLVCVRTSPKQKMSCLLLFFFHGCRCLLGMLFAVAEFDSCIRLRVPFTLYITIILLNLSGFT